MDEKLIYILIATSINIISIPLIYFAFVSKIKEIVDSAVNKLEADFKEEIDGLKKQTKQNEIEIEVLKSRINGFDSWLKEIANEVKTGFKTVQEQLQRHIESHLGKQ